MKYKIEHLQFKPLEKWQNTEEAILQLESGYTVRVLKGKMAVHTYGAPYELSVNPNCHLIPDESVGYLTEKELLALINEINNLSKLYSYN